MEAPTPGRVVLVAEDDPHSLSGYIEFLSTAGFIASGRGDGREALATALENVPDVVVKGKVEWEVPTVSVWPRRCTRIG